MSEPLQCPNGHAISATDTLCPQCQTLLMPDHVPPPPEPLLPKIPGYEIMDLLGRGGMGVVYKARQTSLNRVVALKMIRDAGLAGPEEVGRFRVEAEAVARLQHANIVQIFDIGDWQGRPFISLEFVSGGSLADRLRGVPQSFKTAVPLIQTLALAVHAAHQQGIVHRDLKPANILLAWDGQPKISDFGLAKRLEDTDGRTQSGAILGTPSYMAPEQAEGKSRSVGPAADIYALGTLLYELLTGRPPFLGATPVETIHQVIFQDPVPPKRLLPNLPRALDTICLRCLAKDPARRYRSAAALADDLRRFLADEPISARPTPAWRLALQWMRRQPAAAALIGISGMAVLAAVGLIVGLTLAFLPDGWRSPADPREDPEAQRDSLRPPDAGAVKAGPALPPQMRVPANDPGPNEPRGNAPAPLLNTIGEALDRSVPPPRDPRPPEWINQVGANAPPP
jgi:tRNA A-37 threonylcarbamoyl transferase component Bud32